MAKEQYNPVLLRSVLDTDLYKLSMQQAVLHHFPNQQAQYRFTHRDKDVYFSRKCATRFQECLPRESKFASVSLTSEERSQLEKHCPYLKPHYLDYLAQFRYKPEQVLVTFVPKEDDSEWGRIEIEAKGPWVETIMWEVPLMACLSETYFSTDDTDWTYDGQAATAAEKARQMFEAGCAISEFGTRRRRSWKIQDLVVDTLKKTSESMSGQGKLTGTSNVHLAMKYDLSPVGTIAHEWFMGVAALRGYENANGIALDLWTEVYPSSLLIALTDTFSTDVFFRDFEALPRRAETWMGLRQDSGDPFAFAPRAKDVYERLGIDHSKKTIIFSDSLNVEKVLKLKEQCNDLGFISGFGIGTSLTNDFHRVSDPNIKSKALNMVIKLAGIDGRPCVKISDDVDKITGDRETAAHVKMLYGIAQTA